ncbi:MAG: hypothetical protein WCP96_18000 [Methylococcaceae bacterium]
MGAYLLRMALRETIHVEIEDRRNIETGASDLEKDDYTDDLLYL